MESTDFDSQQNQSKQPSNTSMSNLLSNRPTDTTNPAQSSGIQDEENEELIIEDDDDEEVEVLEPVVDESDDGSNLGFSDAEEIEDEEEIEPVDDEENDEAENVKLYLEGEERDEVYRDEEQEGAEKVVKESKGEKKITLRSFQASLLDSSIQRGNSIIYLPTGTGKTRIAICAMYHYLCKYGTSKKIVFLANTIQLVKQQAEAIKQTFISIINDKVFARDLRQKIGANYIELNWKADDLHNHIVCIHGEKSDDQTVTKRKRIESYMSSRKTFLKEMQKATITVMISQMFLNCLRRGYIKLTDYSFIVFDECHHCSGDHPYSGIMKEFYMQQKKKNKKLEEDHRLTEKERLPILMGLTASPVSQPVSNHNKLIEQLRQLCINLDSNYAPYPQGQNLTNQTEIKIEEIKESEEKELLPDLIEYFERFKDHPTAYSKIKAHFPKYFECVSQVISFMAKRHECLKVQLDGSKIHDPELYLFYDIKECLLSKLRDLWLQLGQFAFTLGFHEMVVQLTRLSGLRNKENTIMLAQIIDILKKYDRVFNQQYGKCHEKFMSSKLKHLIQILKPNEETEIESDRVSDMVLVFAFKRRTVKYLQLVLEKYKDELPDKMKKFYKSVGVTGYASRQKIYRGEDGHSFQSNPSQEESEAIISKYYNNFLETEREQQNNRIHLQSGVMGENKNLNEEMTRMYISKMGKVLLQVEQKYSNQIRKILEFKKKEHRVLITTSVTEEGFDIPGCNLVISFDTPFSMKSYIQIKGRARKKNSKYIIFTSENDTKKMMSNKKIYDNTINAIYELAVNQISKEEINALDNFKQAPSYERAITKDGAILNTNYALELLKSYFTSLKPPNRPYFHFVETTNICFKCVIKFPDSSTCPQSFVVGKPHSRKLDALRSAAFVAVKILKKQGLIRDDLRPSRLQELQDELEMQKYDDLGIYQKDSQYRSVFDRYVQIEQCSEPNSQRKLIRYYFKSLQPQNLEFHNLNKEFNHKTFEKEKAQQFDFQIYFVKFVNNVNSYLMREEEGINQIGILSCFSKEETKEIFYGFRQFMEPTSQEYFQMKYEGDLRINKDQYEKYKIVHNFLLAAEKNNEIDYYNYVNGGPEVQSPNWNMKESRNISYKIDETRKYFPLLLLLKKDRDGKKYVVDNHAVDRCLKHIETFKKIYTYHNKPARYVYQKQFDEDLSKPYELLLDQVKESDPRSKKFLLQSISKDFCFHKGTLTIKPERYSKKFDEQQEGKKKNKLKLKYEKFKKMFNHYSKNEDIYKEEIVKFEIWKQTSKDDINEFMNKQMKIKKMSEEKGLSRFLKEFLLYPVSYPTMIRITLAVKYVFQIYEDYCIALYFRKYYLSNIFGGLKDKLKDNQVYKFSFYPSLLLENAQAIFTNLRNAGKSRYLRELGQAGSYYNKNALSLDMSSIQIMNVSANQSINQDQSMSLNTTNFLGKHDLNNQSILERTFEKVNAKEDEKMVTKVNLDILKSLKIEDILRSLTSKIYKHQKSDNYEQYEFIGDVVLKFLATVQIFIEKTTAQEGEMHIARANLICNSTLHRAAIKKLLFKYIFTTKKRNQPAPFIKVFKDDKKEEDKEKYRNTDIFILGPNDNEEGYQYIPGKVHADAMEALIGIFYLKNKNLHDCQTLLYAFGILNKPTILVKTEKHRDEGYALPSIYSQLEDRIGYKFKHKGLLMQALTHPTFLMYIEDAVEDEASLTKVFNKSKINLNQSKSMSFLGSSIIEGISKIKKHETFYERLEFLGDSFLDLLVVEYLYDQDGDYLNDEGTLSFLKQSAVSNKTLGFIALKFCLHDYILMELDDVDNLLKEFKLISKTLGELPSPLEFSKLKLGSLKVLGDVFESLIGAILIDNEFSYEETKIVVMNMIEKYIKHFTSTSFIEQSPTYKFKEYLDQNNYKKIKISKIAEEGISEGGYLYRFSDKTGNMIGQDVRAPNEKDAWDCFFENKTQAN